MDFHAYQYYPLGFRTPLKGSQVRTETTVDPIWMKLRDDVKCNRVNYASMAYRVQVIRRARELLGDFEEFLLAQDQNPKVSKHGYGMLKDTLEYIKTGRRSASLATWEMLIREEWRSSTYEDLSASKRTVRLSDSLPRPDQYMADWLKHPEGFSDMLCTVNLLFGTDLSAG